MTNQSGMVQKDTGFLLEGLQKGLAFLFLDLPFHPPTDSSPWGAWSLASLPKGGGNCRPNILTPVFSPDGANKGHSRSLFSLEHCETGCRGRSHRAALRRRSGRAETKACFHSSGLSCSKPGLESSSIALLPLPNHCLPSFPSPFPNGHRQLPLVLFLEGTLNGGTPFSRAQFPRCPSHKHATGVLVHASGKQLSYSRGLQPRVVPPGKQQACTVRVPG